MIKVILSLLKLFRDRDQKTFCTVLWILQHGDRQRAGIWPHDSTAYLQFFTPAFSSPSVYFSLAFISPKAISYIDITLPDIQPLFLCGMFPGTSDLPFSSLQPHRNVNLPIITCPDTEAHHHHTTTYVHMLLRRTPNPTPFYLTTVTKMRLDSFPSKITDLFFRWEDEVQ